MLLKNEVFYSSIKLIIYNSKCRYIILIKLMFIYVIEIENRLNLSIINEIEQ